MILREGETWRLYGPVADRAQRPGVVSKTRALQVEAPALVLGELVRDLAAAPVACAEVRSSLQATGGPVHGARGPQRVHAEQADLERRLEWALERRLLVVVQLDRSTPASSVTEPHDTEPPPALAEPSPEEETTWIAIELVDDSAPPRPVPYARYRITLPDGSPREGRLDAMGLARVDGIDPGTCKVTFPDLDRKTWQKA